MNDNKRLTISGWSVICFFACLYPIMPGYFEIIGINASNILVAISVFLLGCISSWKLKNTSKVRFDLKIVFLLYIGYLLLSYLISGDYFEVFWSILFYIILASYIINYVRTPQEFIGILDIMIKTAGVVCVIGIVESATQFNVFELLNNSGAHIYYNALRFGLRRIVGFGYQTITYCVYCMFIMSVTLYRITQLKYHSRKRTLYVAIYALLWINALLTLSRSAILGAIACQSILLARCGWKKFISRMIIVLALAWVGSSIYSTVTNGTNLFLNMIRMLLAVFNENYTDSISASFGTDNLNAVGNRLSLYLWVANSMKDKWLLGWGRTAAFNYTYTYNNAWSTQLTKSSIEVEYLYTIYHFGILGLITEVMVYFTFIRNGLVKKYNRLKHWENKLSFNYTMGVTILVYCLVLFAVNRGAEAHTLYLLSMLFLAYNRSVMDEAILDTLREEKQK